ncbi:hypothetical protein [Ancylobacter defluvii]|uniref:Uncharacterized protein n=1 Tax=Ancylobacter defluvii TaxID=1282440 RepID=A0A9W6K1X4_9HYPH|nr:hypothetical protein [Ancylobacter defluvii]MBS7588321.1 hypothetical protein [Ancylobacter defluvii]GLK86718.1 hypothetical protein GCM10017653_47880 [Ancylobacter defluvii]
MPDLTLKSMVKVLTIREGDLKVPLLEAVEMIDENPAWHVRIPTGYTPHGGKVLALNDIRRLVKELPRI